MAEPVWTADIAIDAKLALSLVREQFPELDGREVEALGIGWDNAAFLIDGTLVFRFPRRRFAAALIAREIAILPGIAPLLPLAISAPRFHGAASPAYPWEFAGYPKLPGTTACGVALGDDARLQLAEPLGAFLRALHRIDAADVRAAGLPGDELGRLDPEKRLRMTLDRVPMLERAGAGGDVLERCVAWLEAHPPRIPDLTELRIIHGDLYARHVLLDARGVPSGIIDWGDVHFGDPALDIAIAHLMLPASDHARFRAAYGPIDEPTWDAARYRAIYHAVLELDYGLRESDTGMRDIGAAALRMLAAVRR